MTASTINNNVAAYGGGISSYTDSNFLTTQTQIINSTISANQASVLGGGIYNGNGLTVIQFSTITYNVAPVGSGSGVASVGDAQTLTAVYSSIIAGNLGSDVDVINAESNTFDSAGFNLIGTGNATGAFGASGDQVIDPDDLLLGPLADNGGPTWTHALLPGSPAIDAGDPGYVYNPNDYDQRGAPFARVADGDGAGGERIDVGAFEVQVPPLPLLFGDYNQNGVVDAADYTVWRNNLGANIALPNEDPDQTPGWVTAEDYDVWKAHFGQTLPLGSGGAAIASVAETMTRPQPGGDASLRLAEPVLAPPVHDRALAVAFERFLPARRIDQRRGATVVEMRWAAAANLARARELLVDVLFETAADEERAVDAPLAAADRPLDDFAAVDGFLAALEENPLEDTRRR